VKCNYKTEQEVYLLTRREKRGGPRLNALALALALALVGQFQYENPIITNAPTIDA